MNILIWFAIAYFAYGFLSIAMVYNMDSYDVGGAMPLQMLITLLGWPAIFPLAAYSAWESARDNADGNLRRAVDWERKVDSLRLRHSRDLDATFQETMLYQDTLAAIEPYVNWREVTDELDGKFCEAWADAIDESHARADKKDKIPPGEGYSPTDRWWREGLT